MTTDGSHRRMTSIEKAFHSCTQRSQFGAVKAPKGRDELEFNICFFFSAELTAPGMLVDAVKLEFGSKAWPSLMYDLWPRCLRLIQVGGQSRIGSAQRLWESAIHLGLMAFIGYSGEKMIPPVRVSPSAS